MKTLILSFMLAGSIPQAQGGGGALQEMKEGKVKYYVSHSNHLIHLEMPYRVSLTLLNLKENAPSIRYLLTVNGQWDSNSRRPEIEKIRQLYPGYLFSGQSTLSDVKGCKMQLSTGRELDCISPPASARGNYFYVNDVLNQDEGDQLKSELEQGHYPQIEVLISVQEPKMKITESYHVSTQSLYRSLLKLGPVFELKQLVRPIAQVLQEAKLSTDSPFYDQAVEALMKECVMERTVNNAQSLQELMSTDLQVKIPTIKQLTYENEELEWSTREKNAELEFSVEMMQGGKKQ